MVDVSVIVLCYKQETTIRRTLESILNQETNYSYEIVIGDDSSPDSTRQICEEFVSKYPGQLSINKEHPNLGVVKNYAECLSRVKGRYIMECAGDDWWHNKKKIDLQVDYMDTHTECVLCYGGYNIYTPINGEILYSRPARIKGDAFEALLRFNHICAPTVCIRTDAMRKIDFPSFIEKGFLVEDYPSWLALSLVGDFHCMDESLVTYSVYSGSIQHTTDYEKHLKYQRSYMVMKEHFAHKANKLPNFGIYIRDSYYESVAVAAVTYLRRKDALEAFYGIKNKSLKIWLKFLVCLFPLSFKLYSNRYRRGLQ